MKAKSGKYRFLKFTYKLIISPIRMLDMSVTREIVYGENDDFLG